jgi:hypothetical protein
MREKRKPRGYLVVPVKDWKDGDCIGEVGGGECVVQWTRSGFGRG